MDEKKRRKIVHEYLVKREAEEEIVYKTRLQEVYEFGLSVGIIRDVLKAKNLFWKILWFALALGAIGICTTFVRNSLITFLDGPTNTKITYRVNTSIRFPLVTVCTYARVNASQVKRLNLSNEVVSYMMSTFKGMYLFYNRFNQRNRDDIEMQYQRFVRSQKNFSLPNFFQENGFECNRFLRNCMFQGMDFDCCSENPLLGDIGKCFVLQSPKFDAQEIPGPSGGLKININNWMEEYTDTLISTNPDTGIQVHIIHPDDSTVIGVSPLVVFPGTHAMIRLNPIFQRLRKTNKNDSCTDTQKLDFFTAYSFEGCFTECIAKLTEQTCNCFQIGMVPNQDKLSPELLCEPEVATACVQPLLQADNMGFLWDIYDIRERCQCPLPCSQWSYDTAVSYSRVPSMGYEKASSKWEEAQIRNGAVNFTRNSEDKIMLDLFFDNLVYTEILEQEQVSLTIVFSQVGGQLAIWLGLRFISIAHLLYYGTIMLFGVCPRWKMKIQQRLRQRKFEEETVHDKKMEKLMPLLAEVSTDQPPSYNKTLIHISPAVDTKIEMEKETESKEEHSPGHLIAPHPLLTSEKTLWG